MEYWLLGPLEVREGDRLLGWGAGGWSRREGFNGIFVALRER